MEFTPIATQEEFEARVKDAYGDVKDLQAQITTLTTERDTGAETITKLQGQVKAYEVTALKQRIAADNGIPAHMADRLHGETEKDIMADAKTMAGQLREVKGPPPGYNAETQHDPKTAALRAMLQNLKGE